MSTKIGDTVVLGTPDAKGDRKPLEKRFRHHWRIDMLAVPKGHPEELEMFKMSKAEKEEFLKEKSSKVSIKRSKVKMDKAFDKRMKELSLLPPRYYVAQKKFFKDTLGSQFEKKMDKNIKGYCNSVYYEYKKAKKLYAKKAKAKAKAKAKEKAKAKGKDSKKGGKAPPKKPKKSLEEKIKEAVEHCVKIAKPKVVHPPPKINRGKRVQISQIEPHLKVMATPKHKYVKPEDNPFNPINLNKVKESALKYKPTARIFEMAIPAPHRLIKEIIPEPGEVNPNALKAVATPRVLALAVPRARAAANDADFNEDAFKISPAALKYVATQRIQELAQPTERS